MTNLTKAMLLQHYKREDIQRAMFEHAQNREVAVRFEGDFFGKRPDILNFPRDVFEFVKQGATSFHCSEELWRNPLQINSEMKRKEQDNLRIGWDLLLDIDGPLELSTIAAHYIVEAIEHHGINCVTCKFSGGKGWHIAIPFEAFPSNVNNKETKDLFPEAPRAIANYLKEMIRRPLGKAILEKESIQNLQKITGKKFHELVKDELFDPFSILSIDTVLIASRHLYRMPYSFNEKSGLISIPYDPKKVLSFKKEEADYKNIVVGKFKFIERENAKQGEAKKLLQQALDFKSSQESIIVEIKKKPTTDFQKIETAISEENFPPCMKIIVKGIEDGKKRALFAMINFLGSVGWSYEQMESWLKEWNKRNPEPLRETYIIGQLRQWKKKESILPPNCMKYYEDLHVCQPDSLCKKIKNPVNYAIIKTKIQKESVPKPSLNN
ncbi:MAG: hypothetical protein QW331_01685 [Candidatus Woesearchaeota archaeon]